LLTVLSITAVVMVRFMSVSSHAVLCPADPEFKEGRTGVLFLQIPSTTHSAQYSKLK
jgi:hypothetical protein